MIDVNSSAIVLGFAVGLPISALFFWGLNWAMRLALVSEHPGRLLLLSFFCRMVILLGIGFGLTALSGTLWSLAGYMLAFVVIRVVVVLRTKLTLASHVSEQQEGINAADSR
ncbi:MAG TPA: ATP synthase subunit I [Thiopseudomonas sp.]|nr:ATP synthase subunit I [Thiopseudomonas sp.]